MLIDFHTHTRLSDGEHDLAEWALLAARRGYAVLGLAEHVGLRVVEERMEKLATAVAALSDDPGGPRLIPGCEITLVPPGMIAGVARRARDAGAEIVLVHGESALEPRVPGTNRAAIEAGVDILAHPGLVTREDAGLARERGVLLEISGRKVHCLTNGHVLATARETGAEVVVDSDAHAASDLFTEDRQRLVGRGAGMTEAECDRAAVAARRLAERLLGEPLSRSAGGRS